MLLRPNLNQAQNADTPDARKAASGVSKTEREGFEPSVGVTPHWISSPARSATLSPLLIGGELI